MRGCRKVKRWEGGRLREKEKKDEGKIREWDKREEEVVRGKKRCSVGSKLK